MVSQVIEDVIRGTLLGGIVCVMSWQGLKKMKECLMYEEVNVEKEVLVVEVEMVEVEEVEEVQEEVEEIQEEVQEIQEENQGIVMEAQGNRENEDGGFGKFKKTCDEIIRMIMDENYVCDE
jgi:hypothetical protein